MGRRHAGHSLHARQVRLPRRAHRARRPPHAGRRRPAPAAEAALDGARRRAPPLTAAAPWRSRPSARPSRRRDFSSARATTARPRRRTGPGRRSATHGVFPDLEALHVVARAITPPRRPKRFDTRFFAVDRAAIVGEVAGLIGPEAELVELAWVDLAERGRARPARRITQRRSSTSCEARLAGGFAPELPVPFYYERRMAASCASSCRRSSRCRLRRRAPAAFDRTRVAAIAAAIACVTAVGIGLSLSIPLLSLEMERMGVSGTMIGLNTAVAGIASICRRSRSCRASPRGSACSPAPVAVRSSRGAASLIGFKLALRLRLVVPATLRVLGGARRPVRPLGILDHRRRAARAARARHGDLRDRPRRSASRPARPLFLAVVGTERLAALSRRRRPVRACRPCRSSWRAGSRPTIGRGSGRGVLLFVLAAPSATLAALVFGAARDRRLRACCRSTALRSAFRGERGGVPRQRRRPRQRRAADPDRAPIRPDRPPPSCSLVIALLGPCRRPPDRAGLGPRPRSTPCCSFWGGVDGRALHGRPRPSRRALHRRRPRQRQRRLRAPLQYRPRCRPAGGRRRHGHPAAARLRLALAAFFAVYVAVVLWRLRA